VTPRADTPFADRFMTDAKTTKAYVRLAAAYVAAPGDSYLAEAESLGVALLERQVGLEELAELHGAAICHVLATRPEAEPADLVAHCSRLLRCLLSVYERDTREREVFLRTVIEAAPAAINIRDREGRYRVVNKLLADLFGTTPEEMVGRTGDDDKKTDYEDIHGTDDNSRVFETGEALFNLEGEYVIGGERSVWLGSKAPIKNERGEVAYVATVSVDISERKRAEEELRHSEQKFRRIVEAHPLPVWLVDVESGRVLYESPAAAALLGLEWPATEQRNVRDYYVDPADRVRYLAQIQETGEVRDMEFQVRRRDGSAIWVSLTSRLIVSEEPGVAITSMIDLTERLAFEEELERQREALHLSEKMSALGELLASVAHELNNPLSVVVGQSMLLMETSMDERIRSRVERIGNAAERCARIVKTFLAMARQQPSISELIDINAAIEGALNACTHDLAAAQIEVSLDLSPELPPVAADFDQIGQVVTNLIVNAQHAMEAVDRDRKLRITSSHRPSTGEVVIKVKDSGPGIPDDIRGRIFDPFFTTKGSGKGTGIGLTLCHRIVDAHGGRIRLDDRATDGAAFVIKLPCRDVDTVGQPQVAARSGSMSTLKVLAIDDEAGMTELVADILRFDGHIVTTANSGDSALDRLADQEFDVILSDLRMPGLDGPSLFRHLEASRPELVARVAFITGDTLSAEIHRFLQATQRPYLEKPVGPDDIRALVRQIADRGAT
jgi:PAS domain S-box-containing protein